MTRIVVLITLLASAPMTRTVNCDVPLAAAATTQIRALNQAYIEASRDADAAWFDAHMSEDVVVILGNGLRLTKPDFLARIANSPRQYSSLTVRGATVRVFGTTAQIDADAPFELEDGTRGISRYIDTYAWIDCRWQVISAQINRLAATGS